jgi:YidC/Oxa1 family membrane protein insertase
MEGFTQIWNVLLVWPIEGALLALTEFFSNAGLAGAAGLAIIVFTIAVRTLMLPLGMQQARSQRAMAALQPQLREIQKKYAGDRTKQSQEQMRLYRESGVNPVAGCLPLVLQMPIWFALYSALINLGNNVESFQTPFLWIPNLAAPDPLYILPVLTGATQWVVQRMSTMPSTDSQTQQMNRMMEFMPIMFFIFSLQVASGLALYWVISNVYSFFQQYFLVGWGNLPFLGAKATPAEPGTGGNGAAVAAPRGRTRSRSAPRRKRGK